jgi:hypothetical protein
MGLGITGRNILMGQKRTRAGVQISFDGRYLGALDTNLNILIDSIRAGDFLAGFHISPSLLVISSILTITGIYEEDIIASLAFSTGVQLHSNDKIDLDGFLEVLGEKAKAYLDRPQQEYRLLFPLNLIREKIPDIPILVHGISFEIHDWKEIRGYYDIDALIVEVKKFIKYPHDPIYWDINSTPLVARIYGRNAEEVFRRCEIAYDLYRSFLNFFLDRSITVQLARPSPLAKIMPPVGYGVFLSDGKLECPYTDIEHLNNQHLCSESIESKVIQDFIDKSSSRVDVDIRLIEAIKSHNMGLETTNWDNSYLAFWRVFEILAFGSRTDYNMDEVVSRVCVLIDPPKTKIKEFLSLCSKRRNSLVHRGVFPVEAQSLVLTLKYYSALSIWRFLQLSKVYHKANELDEYYELAQSSDANLLERKSVIENILAERK